MSTRPGHHGLSYFNLTTSDTGGERGTVVGSNVVKYVHGTSKVLLRGDVSGEVDFANKTLILRISNIHDPSDFKTVVGAHDTTPPVIHQADLTNDGFVIRGESPSGQVTRAVYHHVSEEDVNKALEALRG